MVYLNIYIYSLSVHPINQKYYFLKKSKTFSNVRYYSKKKNNP